MDSIESRRAPCGCSPWAGTFGRPFGDHGRWPGTIIDSVRIAVTVLLCISASKPGAGDSDYTGELFWRKRELKGKDKPKATTVNA